MEKDNLEMLGREFTLEFRSLLLKYIECDDEKASETVFSQTMSIVIGETIIAFFLMKDEFFQNVDYFKPVMKNVFFQSVDALDYDYVLKKVF